MIDPDSINTVRVGELPPADFNLTDNLPHEIGTELKRGTIEQLADVIGAHLGASDSLAFNPTTVTDGGTLPETTSNEWMLVGKGTFSNVGGGDDIITTEELNALTSNGSYWSLAVQIPINVELAGITQNIRSGYTQTTPSEDAVYNAIANILTNITELSTDDIDNNSEVDGGNVTEALNNLLINSGFNSVASAYVESNGNNSTAQIGNSRKAYLTIDAALDALPSTGGIIKIGLGSFLSPTPSKIKDNTKFFGSGKPYPNMTVTYIDEFTKPTITSPTAMIGGTILQGLFNLNNKNNIEIHDLGVDTGKTWIDANNGGVALDALRTCIQNPLLPNSSVLPAKGIVVSNVSTLCYSATALVHAMLIENTVGAKISNVSTYFGYHGLVIKSTGTNVNGCYSLGHDGEGVIIKADTYSYSSDINVNNIYISSISAFDGGGLMIDGGSGTIQRVNISNANIEFTKYGITDTYNTGIDGINLNNISVYKTQGNGIYFNDSSKNVVISNVNQDNTISGNGVEIQSKPGCEKTLINVHTKNSSQYGIYLTGGTGSIKVNNLSSENDVSGIVISGNIYGHTVKSNSVFTGTLTLDTGNINGKNFASSVGASNSIGSGSAFYFDNNLSSTSKRFLTVQMNALNGLDFWEFNGSTSTWTNTGTKINSNGSITVGNLSGSGNRMTLSEPDGTQIPGDIAPTSGTYTPASAGGATWALCYWSKVGKIVTLSLNASYVSAGASSSVNINFPYPSGLNDKNNISEIRGNGSYGIGDTLRNSMVLKGTTSASNGQIVLGSVVAATYVLSGSITYETN